MRVVLALKANTVESVTYAIACLEKSHPSFSPKALRKLLSGVNLSVSIKEQPVSTGLLLLSAALGNTTATPSMETICKFLADRNMAMVPRSVAEAIGVISSHCSSGEKSDFLIPFLNRLLLRSAQPGLLFILGMSSSLKLSVLLMDPLGDAFWGHLTGENDELRVLAAKVLDLVADKDEEGLNSFYSKLEKTYSSKSVKGKKAILLAAGKLPFIAGLTSLKSLLAKEANEELMYFLLLAIGRHGADELNGIWADFGKQSKANLKTAYLAALLSLENPVRESVVALLGKKETLANDAAMTAVSTGSPEHLKTMLKPGAALSEANLMAVLGKYPLLPIYRGLSSPLFDHDSCKYLWKAIISIIDANTNAQTIMNLMNGIKGGNVAALAEVLRERPIADSRVAELLSKLILAQVKTDADKLEMVDVAHQTTFAECRLWTRICRISCKCTPIAPSSIMIKMSKVSDVCVLKAIVSAFPQVIDQVGKDLVEFIMKSVPLLSDTELQIIAASEESLPVIDGTNLFF